SGVPIDLMFTDVVMPGPLRSPELARKARERIPGIAVLFTSGYTENAIVHGGRVDEGVDLLSKPYTREKLARKLRHVLRNQQQRNKAKGSAAPAPSGRPIVGAGAATRPLRVLLVEDDELIRMATAEMLTDLGHVVQEAGSSSQATAILQQQPIDLLMTDIGLGDGSGVDLAAASRRGNPALRIVFVSGYDLQREATADNALAGAVLLRKPFDQRDLQEAFLAVAPGTAV
uniref:response regulator n=1 Tax=Arenibaculum pallidiluteum TaxID=2812559 RepID=UPI001A95AD9F